MRTLAQHLQTFYAEVRTKEGKPYSTSGLVNIRSGLQRYLQSAPYFRKINIASDPCFRDANTVFKNVLEISKESLANPRPPIDAADFVKLQEYVHKNMTYPKGLQNKVLFDVLLHFGKMGRGQLRDLRKDSVVFETDSEGREYATLRHFKVNSADGTTEIIDTGKRMYAEVDDKYCPVESLKTYISLLNPASYILFQRPNQLWYRTTDKWYERVAVGRTSLGSFMTRLSQEAKLDTRYTNDCINKGCS